MLRLRSLLFAALLCPAFALGACHARAPQLERGSPDPAVVLVLIKNSDGDQGHCTGVVISPHLVLTAAHCLSLQTVGPHPRIALFLGGDLENPLRTHRVEVAATTFDPAFDANVLPKGHDVGLVMSRAPLEIAPLPINTTPLPPQIDTARLIGYGITNPDSEKEEGGVRRSLPVRVRSKNARFIELATAEERACAGDSGGPILARLVAGGPEVVIGIISYGDTRCRRGSSVTNLAAYANYLRDFIARDSITP